MACNGYRHTSADTRPSRCCYILRRQQLNENRSFDPGQKHNVDMHTHLVASDLTDAATFVLSVTPLANARDDAEASISP